MLLKVDRFVELCELSGLNVTLRRDSTIWDGIYASLSYQSVRYISSVIDYDLAYQQGHGGQWCDFSCVISVANKPIALWPISISKKGDNVDLSSQGKRLLPPIFVKNCSYKIVKVITASALKLIDKIIDEIGLGRLSTAPAFDGSQKLSYWHKAFMLRGAKCFVQHDLYVDLSLPIEKIKKLFRKSYKSLVVSGEYLWDIEVVSNSIDIEVWEEFRSLHYQVAGRITRSKESWDLQYHTLKNDESFLVVVRDDAKRMVGGGFFICSRDEGMYAVAAYDRTLFDKPLGHVVQFRAIQEMKRRKCRWYFIGRRFYPGEQPVPSNKELSISYFKEGFSTDNLASFSLVQEF